ncbi:uncharacterized protein LOC142334577 isoform X3 [Convolutriloba macropyga]|uniref:uncharacterized protein LOC142334577 isoform X3 n=1 Tax=Convolutriloba macropyga TaxID=536237 RepID=UPI003F522783
MQPGRLRSFDTSEEDESVISGMVTSANEEGNNSTHCEEKLIRIGAIGGGLEDALLDETALDDLIHMQQQEILELVAERRVFDIHDDVQPGLYTQQFQTKVAEYLLDGGKTSTASKRLNIPLEALKAWKLKLIESTKRKKKNGKPKRDKVGVPTQVNIRHYAAVAAPRSSVPKPKKPKVISHENKKSVGRPKFSHGSKEPANIDAMCTRGSRRQKNASGGAPGGDMAKTKPTKPMSTNGSTLGVEKSMDVMEVMPLGGEGCNDEFFLILDKGASELSSDEAPEPYPESLLMDRRNQIEQQKAQSRVSLFVCNKCREIFRCSVSLLNHEKMCKMFRPVPFV